MTKGRPSKYDKLSHDTLVYNLALLGLTDVQIAGVLEIDEATLNRWKKKHPGFYDCLQKGKQIADSKVARSLYQRATGYSYKEDKVFQYKGQPVVIPTLTHVPPDVTAQIFWLKNRQPHLWRDKHELQHAADTDSPMKFKVEFVDSEHDKNTEQA